MVAEHALCKTPPHTIHDEVEHCRAVRATIAEVAREDRAPALRMAAVGGVSEVPEQRRERVGLAVDVSDHIQRTIEQAGKRAVGGHRQILKPSASIVAERHSAWDRG
jgi:hypothetical protein